MTGGDSLDDAVTVPGQRSTSPRNGDGRLPHVDSAGRIRNDDHHHPASAAQRAGRVRLVCSGSNADGHARREPRYRVRECVSRIASRTRWSPPRGARARDRNGLSLASSSRQLPRVWTWWRHDRSSCCPGGAGVGHFSDSEWSAVGVRKNSCLESRSGVLPPLVGLGALLVLVVGLGYSVTAAYFGWCIAQVAAAVAAVVAVRTRLRPFSLPQHARVEARRMLTFGLSVGVASLIALLNYRIEVFVLESKRGVDAVGLLSLHIDRRTHVGRIRGIGRRRDRTCRKAVRPRRRRDDHKGRAARARSRRCRGWALAVIAPPLVPILFGVSVPGECHTASHPAPRRGHVLPRKHHCDLVPPPSRADAVRRRPRPLSTLVTLAAALTFIPPYGAAGAAAATTIGYGLSMTLACVLFVRAAPVRVRDFIPGRTDIEDYRLLGTQSTGLQTSVVPILLAEYGDCPTTGCASEMSTVWAVP